MVCPASATRTRRPPHGSIFTVAARRAEQRLAAAVCAAAQGERQQQPGRHHHLCEHERTAPAMQTPATFLFKLCVHGVQVRPPATRPTRQTPQGHHLIFRHT